MSAYDAVVMVALNDPRHVPAADPGLDRLARAVTGSPADVVRVGLRRGLALPDGPANPAAPDRTAATRPFLLHQDCRIAGEGKSAASRATAGWRSTRRRAATRLQMFCQKPGISPRMVDQGTARTPGWSSTMANARPGSLTSPRPIIRRSQPVTSRQRWASSTLQISPLATMGSFTHWRMSAMRSQYAGGR